MFSVYSVMNSFASACAGASFALHSNLQDAVLASVFVIIAVLVHRDIVYNSKTITE